MRSFTCSIESDLHCARLIHWHIVGAILLALDELFDNGKLLPVQVYKKGSGLIAASIFFDSNRTDEQGYFTIRS